MRTLAQLRTAVYQALGFIDPFTNVTTRTLAELRTSLMAVGGYAAQAASPPPGMTTLLDEFINTAHDTVWRRYPMGEQGSAMPTRMSATSDTTTLDYVPVLAMASGLLRAHMGHADAKAYFERAEQWIADAERCRPANAQTVVDQALQDCQRDLYQRLPMLEMERFFTWTLAEDDAFYALDADDSHVATETLDPRKITWAGIERDGIWIPLKAGIPPERYSFNDWTGWPTHYEIRDQIELWPTPDASTQTLKIKGYFGLGAFTSDAHEASIEDHALFLMATAVCCEAFQWHPMVKGKSPQTWYSRLEAHLRGLIAGSHQTRRYIPGERVTSLYVEPVPTVPHA